MLQVASAGFLMFLVVFIAGLLLLHAYLWLRKVRDTALPWRWRVTISLALAVGFVAILCGQLIWRTAPNAKVSLFVMCSFVWLGAMFYLALFHAGWDVMRTTAWLVQRVRGR